MSITIEVGVNVSRQSVSSTTYVAPCRLCAGPNDGSGKLWAIANERDEIGPRLVPDYLTSLQDGGFYGWPYSYYGKHVDPRAIKRHLPTVSLIDVRPNRRYRLRHTNAAGWCTAPAPDTGRNQYSR